MNVSIDQDGIIELTEVYNGIKLKTNSNEKMYICMRDSGFELNYQGQEYQAKDGVIGIMKINSARTLKDFIDANLQRNTLVRLWYPTQQGHELVIDKPIMEWEARKGDYKDHTVMHITDILCDSTVEAVNIVLKRPTYGDTVS